MSPPPRSRKRCHQEQLGIVKAAAARGIEPPIGRQSPVERCRRALCLLFQFDGQAETLANILRFEDAVKTAQTLEKPGPIT